MFNHGLHDGIGAKPCNKNQGDYYNHAFGFTGRSLGYSMPNDSNINTNEEKKPFDSLEEKIAAEYEKKKPFDSLDEKENKLLLDDIVVTSNMWLDLRQQSDEKKLWRIQLLLRFKYGEVKCDTDVILDAIEKYRSEDMICLKVLSSIVVNRVLKSWPKWGQLLNKHTCQIMDLIDNYPNYTQDTDPTKNLSISVFDLMVNKNLPSHVLGLDTCKYCSNQEFPTDLLSIIHGYVSDVSEQKSPIMNISIKTEPTKPTYKELLAERALKIRSMHVEQAIEERDRKRTKRALAKQRKLDRQQSTKYDEYDEEDISLVDYSEEEMYLDYEKNDLNYCEYCRTTECNC